MQVTLENLNQQILGCNGFSQVSTSSAQGPFWREWELSPQIGTGKFWVYEEKDLFDIKIHDFSFREDSSVDSTCLATLALLIMNRFLENNSPHIVV